MGPSMRAPPSTPPSGTPTVMETDLAAPVLRAHTFGTVANDSDCNDGNITINPATEVCDGIDNDCDSNIDGNAVDSPSGTSTTTTMAMAIPMSFLKRSQPSGYGNNKTATTAMATPTSSLLRSVTGLTTTATASLTMTQPSSLEPSVLRPAVRTSSHSIGTRWGLLHRRQQWPGHRGILRNGL